MRNFLVPRCGRQRWLRPRPQSRPWFAACSVSSSRHTSQNISSQSTKRLRPVKHDSSSSFGAALEPRPPGRLYYALRSALPHNKKVLQQLYPPRQDNLAKTWRCLSWEDYLIQRSYLDADSMINTPLLGCDPHKVELVALSSLLSYPLTLAYHLDTLLAPKPPNKERYESTIRIAIVGAVMETSMLQLWHELSILDGRSISLHFIGPLLLEKSRPRTLLPYWNGEDNTRLSIEISQATVEEVLTLQGCRSYDAFVAFHPGAGVPDKYTWETAFAMIQESGVPLMLTAFGEDDAEGDAAWWEATFGTSLPTHQSNPCASRVPEWPSLLTPKVVNGMVTFCNTLMPR